MILWWFMLEGTSRKPTNMSIAILNFAIWEVQIQIRTLCRTCKRKVGCCGRCLLMRKIGMNDRWVHSFETSPDVVPDFDWLCRCDLKIFQGACKRRCGDSQHSRKSHWRPPHHWKRQGHGFNAVPANVCVWWFQPVIFLAPVHFPILVGYLFVSSHPNSFAASTRTWTHGPNIQALEFIPNSVRLWKEAVSLEAPGWRFFGSKEGDPSL